MCFSPILASQIFLYVDNFRLKVIFSQHVKDFIQLSTDFYHREVFYKLNFHAFEGFLDTLNIFSFSRIYPAMTSLTFLNKGLELHQFGKILSILSYLLWIIS